MCVCVEVACVTPSSGCSSVEENSVRGADGMGQMQRKCNEDPMVPYSWHGFVFAVVQNAVQHCWAFSHPELAAT